MQITGASATGNTLRGNFIGVAANGSSFLGHTCAGITVTGNDIASACDTTADRIAGCIVYNYTNTVWQGSSACGVRADVVAEYRVESGIGVGAIRLT